MVRWFTWRVLVVCYYIWVREGGGGRRQPDRPARLGSAIISFVFFCLLLIDRPSLRLYNVLTHKVIIHVWGILIFDAFSPPSSCWESHTTQLWSAVDHPGYRHVPTPVSMLTFSYIPYLLGGGDKKETGTLCLHMRLITKTFPFMSVSFLCHRYTLYLVHVVCLYKICT